MRPVRTTEAHATDRLGELVCSNSLRSDDAETNAVGVLHAELRACGSIVMRAADAHQVPAGGALAVDREAFAAAITAELEAHPLIEIRREEIAGPPDPAWDSVVVASEPVDAARDCWQALPCNTLVCVKAGAVSMTPFEVGLRQAA